MALGKSQLSFLLFSLIFFTSSHAESALTQTEFDCVITPSKVADLGSNAPGVIEHIAVDRNIMVKKGEVVFTLDDSVEEATVELATKQAELISELKMCKIKIAHAKRELNRAEKAYRKKALSLHEFDRKKVELKLEKTNLLKEKEKLALAQQELIRAKAKLAHKRVKAPFAGIITDKMKSIGEYVNDEPVVQLAQLDPLYIEVIIPVSYKGEIKEGMHAHVCSDKNDGKGWRAKVNQIDKVVDARSGTYGVRLILPNPELKITAGIRCDLKFDTPRMTHNFKGVTSRHE